MEACCPHTVARWDQYQGKIKLHMNRLFNKHSGPRIISIQVLFPPIRDQNERLCQLRGKGPFPGRALNMSQPPVNPHTRTHLKPTTSSPVVHYLMYNRVGVVPPPLKRRDLELIPFKGVASATLMLPYARAV